MRRFKKLWTSRTPAGIFITKKTALLSVDQKIYLKKKIFCGISKLLKLCSRLIIEAATMRHGLVLKLLKEFHDRITQRCEGDRRWDPPQHFFFRHFLAGASALSASSTEVSGSRSTRCELCNWDGEKLDFNSPLEADHGGDFMAAQRHKRAARHEPGSSQGALLFRSAFDFRSKSLNANELGGNSAHLFGSMANRTLASPRSNIK